MVDSAENVFVLGLDSRNRELLHDLPQLRSYRFHELLGRGELMRGEEIVLAELLDKAQGRLDSFDGSVDAVVGYWDFPVSSMVPILSERFGLTSAGLRAVVTCEHKYWSRLEQASVTTAHPPFALIDLSGSAEPPDELRYPMWLKPVKSYSSDLAFEVNDRAEFDHAMAQIRAGIGRVGKAFDFLLSMLDLPAEVAAAGGQAVLAEEEVSGQQVTAEGYCFRGEPHVYGLVDSVLYPGRSSFLRYQYPSQVPAAVAERICEVAGRVMRRIGLESAPFNVEFFWDRERDRINILEINPRLSQSHAPLFEFVDGVPNHQCMVRLALGRDPELPSGAGAHSVAAKWYLRTFTDAVVRRAPSDEDVERVRREFPDAIVDVVARRGDRLSDLHAQDSYSYELAAVYLGAGDESELEDKHRRCVDLLPFELEEDTSCGP